MAENVSARNNDRYETLTLFIYSFARSLVHRKSTRIIPKDNTRINKSVSTVQDQVYD